MNSRSAVNLRILVAEDNSTNQKVARGLLKHLGYSADVVDNGEEALKSLESTEYDLVFMDMRMPVMDGIEATRRIRDQRSAVRNHRVPIIAMTANADNWSRDECLGAGMNGYVSKPVSVSGFKDAIEQALQANAAGEMPGPLLETGPTVYDRKGVLARMMGNSELANLVVAASLSDIPRQIEILRACLDSGDISGSGLQAHSIKGAAANAGAVSLRELAHEMESAADAGELDAVRSRISELENDFVQFENAVRREEYADACKQST